MTVYKLFIEKAVYKQLKNIPERDYQKIIASIAALANNPVLPDAKNLKADRVIGFGKGTIVLFTRSMTRF